MVLEKNKNTQEQLFRLQNTIRNALNKKTICYNYILGYRKSV